MARILIAEDQDGTRQTYALALRSAGHEVLEASDGADALQIIAAGTAIDLLLSDVDMPGMTGVELAKAVLDVRTQTPIILMSALGDDGFRGADKLGPAIKARLTKPVANRDLLAAIATALNG